jgi:DNA-binding MarR family transcriptional regulator
MKTPTSSKPKRSEPPEPDPFTPDEFRVWRGFLRVHREITDELNRRLQKTHDLSLLHYGVLITLITVPERRMRMSDIAERVLTSPSGMTRAVVKLADEGLVTRDQDPGDRRSYVIGLTARGVRRLRRAQITHHACVRELLLSGLSASDLRRLAAVYDPPTGVSRADR